MKMWYLIYCEASCVILQPLWRNAPIHRILKATYTFRNDQSAQQALKLSAKTAARPCATETLTIYGGELMELVPSPAKLWSNTSLEANYYLCQVLGDDLSAAIGLNYAAVCATSSCCG
jgi:hypothetical protein